MCFILWVLHLLFSILFLVLFSSSSSSSGGGRAALLFVERSNHPRAHTHTSSVTNFQSHGNIVTENNSHNNQQQRKNYQNIQICTTTKPRSQLPSLLCWTAAATAANGRAPRDLLAADH